MLDGIRADLERQLERLLEEAEKPMRVEEILPHLDPVMPHPNDIAELLHELAAKRAVEQDGSFYRKPTPVPVDSLFEGEAERKAAEVIIAIIRELDEKSGEGARSPLVIKLAQHRGVTADRALDVVAILRNAGEAYSVGGDRLRLAKS